MANTPSASPSFPRERAHELGDDEAAKALAAVPAVNGHAEDAALPWVTGRQRAGRQNATVRL